MARSTKKPVNKPARQRRRPATITLDRVTRELDRVEKQLERRRKTASSEEKKRIDLKIKAVKDLEKRVDDVCGRHGRAVFLQLD